MLVGNTPSAPGLERSRGEATPGTQLLPESSFRGFLSKEEQCKHGGNEPAQQKGMMGSSLSLWESRDTLEFVITSSR